MARISLGICLMFVIASSVIYEAQGTFLLKHFLRKRFPRKSNEFTPFANKGMLMFVTDLESNCPPTTEFKTFFTQYKSYMTFIESASTSSQNVDAEMTAKCDGLFKAMSALSAGKGAKSADAGSMKATILSMGKTMLAQKKKAVVMTLKQKKELVLAMVKWTRMLATFLKSASEKKGKTINIASYGLDVDVNDKSIIGESTETTSSTKTENESTTPTSPTTNETPKATTPTSPTTSETPKATTPTSPTTSETPKATTPTSPTTSKTPKATTPTSPTTSETPKATTPTSPTTSGSLSNNSPSRSISFGARGNVGISQTNAVTVEQVEAETSKNVMTFIMNLEKKCPQNEEYKGFFERLKSTMAFPSKSSPRKREGLFSRIKSAAGKVSNAMAFIRARIAGKSAEAKKSMENYQGEVVKCMEELDAIYSKIVSQNKGKSEGSLTCTAEQQKEIQVTITKWEQITTQFVETAVQSETQTSSSSSSLGKLQAN
ncbi:hypothetical protein V5N11_001236 [Cardamine amara subsp. amara]|uniref:DUF1216 domain-containing protein n=1 Tax=Cardamine amara subsp. amara TaxID=228776 RepID=A0ABD1A8T6_CARAN